MNHSVAADADFLREQAIVVDLQQNSLLHLQADQLLVECACKEKLVQAAVKYADLVLERCCAVPGEPKLQPLQQAHIQISNNDAFLLNPSSNAHVLPTIERTILIPTDHFDRSDYKKGRYWKQRNALVERVAQHLAKDQSQVGHVYRRWCDEPRRLYLILVPPHTKKPPKFRLHLHFGMSDIDWIPPIRLVPNRNNMGNDSTNPTSRDLPFIEATALASRLYNHSLLDDARHCFWEIDSHQDENDNGSHEPSNLCAAVKLLQIWCLQRGLLRRHDGLDVWQIRATLRYLKRTKHINVRMAPLHIVTACCKLWAELITDGAVHVIPVPHQTEAQTIAKSSLALEYQRIVRESSKNSNGEDPPTLLALYQQTFPAIPILLDSSMRYNFYGNWSPAFGRVLQQVASQSLQSFTTISSHHQQHAFQNLFLTTGRFWHRHDAYIQIPWQDIKHSNTSYEIVAQSVVETLYQALGKRVQAIDVWSTGNGMVTRHENAVEDSDNIPSIKVVLCQDKGMEKHHSSQHGQSPMGGNTLVLGFCVNPDHCYGLVDRCPSDGPSLDCFLHLWGPKAQLRRFKDGAIVHAVVWDDTEAVHNGTCNGESSSPTPSAPYFTYHNGNVWQGAIVERVVRHILKRHFLKSDTSDPPQFALRNVLSIVDGIDNNNKLEKFEQLVSNPMAAHRAVMKAFDLLTEFLRGKSAQTIPVPGAISTFKSPLGLPLTIDAVEPLSPALRYVALYPPIPHPLLGGGAASGQKKRASGAVLSDPIDIQIRFGASSKWPTDLKAIGAAKTAMLIALVKGIEALKKKSDDDDISRHFDGRMNVTPSHADIGFLGYVFRIHVRADPELRLLHSLHQPSEEAMSLLHGLTRSTVVAATHHSMMLHAVYTSFPSASVVVRMAWRWISAHLMADHLSLELVELLVAHVYTDKESPLGVPGTCVTGFLRFLRLLATYDWIRDPLIVDPQHHLSAGNVVAILAHFQKIRGPQYENGPAMYVVSPCMLANRDEEKENEDDKISNKPFIANGSEAKWTSLFSLLYPERVVLSRAVALADRTHQFLHDSLIKFDAETWPAAFYESTESFQSYSALFRIDTSFLINKDASSTEHYDRDMHVLQTESDLLWESTYTRSMQSLIDGPKEMRLKLYKNLMSNPDNDPNGILMEWSPIQNVVSALRSRIGHMALFFYNDLCPDVLAIVWRPHGKPRPFSALVSEYVRPTLMNAWQSDTLVILNFHDLLREIKKLTRDIVTNVKVFDYGPPIQPSVALKRKRESLTSIEGQETRVDTFES